MVLGGHCFSSDQCDVAKSISCIVFRRKLAFVFSLRPPSHRGCAIVLQVSLIVIAIHLCNKFADVIGLANLK
ncbi:hypothetical protein K7X08_009497 [Anisodus acutangulus]|uniref:Uncharacterized protein n=1 Tax=Anisodus acutangulus TaxID=402998 RepID=A0A9Q1N3W6_9SOLA|nr:hypothetical protein K7X08_009497 [Anisodus acutangulus]